MTPTLTTFAAPTAGAPTLGTALREMMKFRLLTTAVLATLATTAAFAADHFSGISAAPNPAKVGQPVTITVAGDTDPGVYCGFKINFGDGTDERKLVGATDGPFPKSATHSYAHAGNYTIRADGVKVDGRFGCTGKVLGQLVIEPAPKPAAAPAPAAVPAAKAGGPTCPEGYAMKGKKAGKAGDFTCTAGKGAKKPEKVMDCGDRLEYFQTKSTLGCRKMAKAKK